MGSKRILPRLNNEVNEEWLSDKSRYSCDGLLKQRLDTPYIKRDNKLVRSTWEDAIDLIVKKINQIDPNQIGGHVGDLVSIESIFAFKKFLKKLNQKI